MNDNIHMDNEIERSMNDNINLNTEIEESMNDNIHMDTKIEGVKFVPPGRFQILACSHARLMMEDPKIQTEVFPEIFDEI